MVLVHLYCLVGDLLFIMDHHTLSDHPRDTHLAASMTGYLLDIKQVLSTKVLKYVSQLDQECSRGQDQACKGNQAVAIKNEVLKHLLISAEATYLQV